jgi:hypothetical protein
MISTEDTQFNQLRARISKYVGDLAKQDSFPLSANNKLASIEKKMQGLKTYEELREVSDELLDISNDKELKLRRKQREEIYSPVCWIDDFLKEVEHSDVKKF